MKKLFVMLAMTLLMSVSTWAYEGMWIPMLVEELNIDVMHQAGFKLDAEDIYSVNKACMKDAVMIFGGGCTGELISDEGLLVTNHHCGLRYIQQHSSVEHNYLTDGFWAMNRGEELPNPDLSVTFLVRMKDVSEEVLKGTDGIDDVKEREEIIKNNIKEIKSAEAIEDTEFVDVESFYYGNQYFLFVAKKYTDVRLVGAPPSAVGNFGGDTDNWIWPRHTGDFSLFRIYANADNEPESYSADNKPFIPKHHFPISLKERKEDDFTMVFGYPGSTQEYLPSFAIKMLTETRYPANIAIRDIKLNIIDNAMNTDASLRIKYTPKAKSISNSWKRMKGEINGIGRFDVIAQKEAQEEAFSVWVTQNEKYESVLSDLEKLYGEMTDFGLVMDIYSEAFLRNASDALYIAQRFGDLAYFIKSGKSDDMIEDEKESIRNTVARVYKDFDRDVDIKLFVALQKYMTTNLTSENLPDIVLKKGYGEDANLKKIYKSSIFGDYDAVLALLDAPNKKILKIKRDPFFKIQEGYYAKYYNIYRKGRDVNSQIQFAMKEYMAAQLEMRKDEVLYPDANFTLRVSYGKISGIEAKDAVQYNYYTTLGGVIEKDNPNIYDYNVPSKLKELYESKDYGRYAQNGEIHVCYIASNHTTGGNSGSPVLDAYGNLIGINFDRLWEGVMSDLYFEEDICRNIFVDIRYVLFLIDKYAGAGYLIDEMTIVE